jgi:S-formylglutathione hydrolase FrmB
VTIEDVSAWGASIDDPSVWGEADAAMIGRTMRAIYGPELAVWKANDPATLAAGLASGDVAIYLDAARQDELALDDGAQHLHAILMARGVEHAWYIGPGHHDFDFVVSRLDDGLRWMAAQLATAR